MKVTMNIPRELIDKAVEVSDAPTKTAAVIRSLEEFIQRRRIETIIQEAGNLHFSEDWEEARHAR
jgi:hypothetical protein